MIRNYAIDFSGALVSRKMNRVLLIRDQPVHEYGGDYFTLLAEWLDEISERLTPRQQPEAAKLQRIIDDLLYLHTSYNLKKKLPNSKIDPKVKIDLIIE